MLVSNCCGVPFDQTEDDFCPKCKEPCEFIYEEEEDGPVYEFEKCIDKPKP